MRRRRRLNERQVQAVVRVAGGGRFGVRDECDAREREDEGIDRLRRSRRQRRGEPRRPRQRRGTPPKSGTKPASPGTRATARAPPLPTPVPLRRTPGGGAAPPPARP